MGYQATLYSPPASPVEEARHGSSTILVVEDSANLLDLLEMLLCEERPYRVLRASTVHKALEAASQAQPDLLLLDYELPDGNGIDLYDLLHAQNGWQAIPAILVSADVPEYEVSVRHLTSIAKPFDVDLLLSRVDAALSGTSLPVDEGKTVSAGNS